MNKTIKVAFIARSTLFTIRGGDTTQVEQTAIALRGLGVEVDIYKANEYIQYNNYDLLHLFNIIRPADHLIHIQKSNLPYVISSVYLDYSNFDLHSRNAWQARVLSSIGKYNSEYLKNILRYIKKQDQLVSYSYLLGHKKAMQKILKNAALCLPNSHSEYLRLKSDLEINTSFQVIPNGVDELLFKDLDISNKRDKKVLCIAQIYGRKNQELLIKACNYLDVNLDIIGKTPPNHMVYLEKCKSIASKKTRFIDFMPQKELLKHYVSAKVHALPSWFETTGLSTLEAGAAGCNLVVSDAGDTLEYFKPIATFCKAGNLKSLIIALENALKLDHHVQTREYILENFTWRIAGQKTFEAYKSVLNI